MMLALACCYYGSVVNPICIQIDGQNMINYTFRMNELYIISAHGCSFSSLARIILEK